MVTCPGGYTDLYVKVTFRCRQCGAANYSEYESAYGDGLNHRCTCGAFYKKSNRITDDLIIKQEFSWMCAHCPCSDSGEVVCCHCGGMACEISLKPDKT